MKSTLRFKFVGIVLFVASSFLIYALFDYYNTVNESKKLAIKQNFLMARDLAIDIDDFIESSQNILYSIALHPAIINNDHIASDAIFAGLLPLYPLHLNILAADMKGQNTGSAVNQDNVHSLNYADKDWFVKASNGVSFVSDLHVSKLFKQPTFMISMPVFSSTGFQTAVLGFPANLFSLQEHLIDSEGLSAKTSLTVLDNKGAILIDSLQKAEIGKPFKLTSIIAEISKSSAGSLLNSDFSGTRRFYSYATVETTGWKVLLGIPVSDVYKEANRAALAHLLFFLVICGSGIAISLFYSKKMGRKVELLINGFEEISAGNLNHTVTISGHDEFSLAGEAFNRMITERKIAEEEIRQLAASLEKRVMERTAELRNTNNELEAFSYAVSHDLQAPVRHVLAFTEIMLQGHSAELSEEGRGHLQRIRRAGENMHSIISHLLSLSGLNRKEINRVHADLTALCRKTAQELDESDPGRAVQVSIEEGLLVYADPGLLEIMIKNLLENAWKYTRKSPAPHIEIGRTTSSGTTCFFIKDNGCGFDMAYAANLYIPFHRLHPDEEYQGTGVGLATVMRIIVRHGGFIRAESTPGAGATFYFNLSQGD